MVNQSERQANSVIDSGLENAARQIYLTYRRLRTKINEPPVGVAIHPKTHRGQLIFQKKPVLLPGECFVQLNRLESEAR